MRLLLLTITTILLWHCGTVIRADTETKRKDKAVIDALLLIDYDRSKPIMKDCQLRSWMDLEVCRFYQGEYVERSW